MPLELCSLEEPRDRSMATTAANDRDRGGGGEIGERMRGGTLDLRRSESEAGNPSRGSGRSLSTQKRPHSGGRGGPSSMGARGLGQTGPAEPPRGGNASTDKAGASGPTTARGPGGGPPASNRGPDGRPGPTATTPRVEANADPSSTAAAATHEMWTTKSRSGGGEEGHGEDGPEEGGGESRTPEPKIPATGDREPNLPALH